MKRLDGAAAERGSLDAAIIIANAPDPVFVSDTAALRAVVEHGVTRNAMLHPRSASGEVIPTTLNASALRDASGSVIGAIGIALEKEVEKLQREVDELKAELGRS